MTFRQLIGATGLSTSTLNHHLEPMQRSGLVHRKLRGANAEFTLKTAEMASSLAQFAKNLAIVETAKMKRAPIRFVETIKRTNGIPA